MHKILYATKHNAKAHPLHYTSGVATHQGHIRKRNQDAYACPEPCTTASRRGYIYIANESDSGELFVVADGVGGSDGGEQASQIAVSTTVQSYYTNSGRSVSTRLEQAVIDANRAVIAHGTGIGGSASTTLTVLLIKNGMGIIAHAGDSRLYRIRNGTIIQLTQDHDLIGEYVRSGAMTNAEAADSDLGSVITRSIGSEPDITPDLSNFRIEKGDSFVLCSDGLTRHVRDEEIQRCVLGNRDPQHAADTLVHLALERGGSDNVTVMVLHPRRRTRPSPVFAIIQVLALIVLLAGLIGSLYIIIH